MYTYATIDHMHILADLVTSSTPKTNLIATNLAALSIAKQLKVQTTDLSHDRINYQLHSALHGPPQQKQNITRWLILYGKLYYYDVIILLLYTTF